MRNREDTQELAIGLAANGNVSVVPNLPVHTAIGAAVGFLLIHPLAMLIHRVFEGQADIGWRFLPVSFSSDQFAMGLYFAVLGAVLGLGYWLYDNRLIRMYDTAKELSATDELTSLSNRRYLSRKLAKEVSRARRYSRNLSLVMVDVDHFKVYNDSYGHQEGDRLLKALAAEMKRALRGTDIPARYGGDEFVIVAVESGPKESGLLAERLRGEIEALALPHGHSQYAGRVTISAGVASLGGRIEDADALVRAADTALYRAKLEGRNRVHVYQDNFLG